MSSKQRKDAGFTLIELMIVMAIIGVLAVVAIPSFIGAIRQAREAVLKEDLHVMRSAIDSYTMDKQKAPQSLDDLLQRRLPEGYSRGPAYPEQGYLGHQHQRRHVFAGPDRTRHRRHPLRLAGNRLRRPAILQLVKHQRNRFTLWGAESSFRRRQPLQSVPKAPSIHSRSWRKREEFRPAPGLFSGPTDCWCAGCR